ncbi:hypothetical protein [Saccharothrix coeruleofusca]|nr:hypothetical protein [Saccharothrix coeruleofusca]MBP2337286.1 hypothetical protein [Saccharothrix coeruleofusca]
MVDVDSPLGRVGVAVDELAAHLPMPGTQTRCPLCSTMTWPCASFLDAARHLHDGGVPVGLLVPLDLHPVLWPPTASAPAPVTAVGGSTTSTPPAVHPAPVRESWAG